MTCFENCFGQWKLRLHYFKLRDIVILLLSIFVVRFHFQEEVLFCEKGVLWNFVKFAGKHLCQSRYFIKKETLAQVLSCEFWEISKNTFSYRWFRLLSHIGSIRSSRSQMFFKIGILKNFAIFTGKHLCWILFFNKIAGL